MQLDSNNHKLNLDIQGMTCAACSARIEKVISRIEGVQDISVNLPLGRAVVLLQTDSNLDGHIVERINQLGYHATKREDEVQVEADSKQGVKLIISAVLTIPLVWAMVRHYTMTSGIWIPELFLQPWFQWILATPIQFVIGAPFYFRAFKAIKNRSANMDVLVVLSTTSAYLYSHYMTMQILRLGESNPHAVYFETSAMIITVVLLGKWLETSAKERSLKAIRLLHNLRPEITTIMRDGIKEAIALNEVKVGDTLVISPGEVIPLDGQVKEGRTTVDESFVTGESVPVEKRQQDRLIGGSQNMDGSIVMKVTATGDQTALSKMISLMEEAQGSKAEIARYVDRIAAVFVPIILVFTIMTLCIWTFWLSPDDFEGALFKAIAVLVIACPCALGLATPTSILVGTGRAVQAGVLFKEGKHMEQLRLVDIVLLDKTGTLTHGTPQVTDIITENGKEMNVLRLAASAEKLSEHPFAKAIVKEAVKRGQMMKEPQSFQAVIGFGVISQVEQSTVIIGSIDFIKQHGLSTEKYKELSYRLELEGKSVLHIAIDESYAGLIAVVDTLKPSTPQAIRRLKKLRTEVMMVTGDQRRTANIIANKAGITRVYAGMLPTDKVDLVRRLQQKGHKVAMVGDGINDAPALAAADIGIAIGTGVDIAKEAADVNLLRNNLGGVADAIVISHKTMRNIRQNLMFALLYNSLAIPLAFMGLMAPWIAGTAMALSSVSVVINALRLQRVSLGR